MDELEDGKQKFLEIVKSLDASVEVVIPTIPSRSLLLISLTKGPNRKFMTVHEDDMLDLPQEPGVQGKISALLQESLGTL
jgi:hypothetical protein